MSFWHYYLYWLAYRHGAVRLDVFKRDAVSMKAVSLCALAVAYAAAPFDPTSLAVVAAGFLLNAVAAAALGADRTYYGHEVAGLPARRITAFPYSIIAHPMLVGNIAAFGGTLLNAGFREQWWPLACVHIALNLGLLVMELAVTPRRRAVRYPTVSEAAARARPLLVDGWIVAAGAALGAAVGAAGGPGTSAPPGALVSAFAAAYGCILHRCYSSPASACDGPGNLETETPT